MSAIEPAKEAIVRQLQEAVERLQDDIARVEFWTDALGGFAQSIPDYDPASSELNQFMLRAGPGETGRASDSAPRRADHGDSIRARRAPGTKPPPGAEYWPIRKPWPL